MAEEGSAGACGLQPCRLGLDFMLMAGEGGTGAGGGWGHNNYNVVTSGQVCHSSLYAHQCNVLCAFVGAGGGSGRTDLVLDASAPQLNLSCPASSCTLHCVFSAAQERAAGATTSVKKCLLSASTSAIPASMIPMQRDLCSRGRRWWQWAHRPGPGCLCPAPQPVARCAGAGHRPGILGSPAPHAGALREQHFGAIW